MEVTKMEINSISNTSFNGAFRLKGMTPEVKKQVPDIIKKGRQIFENFENTGDTFIACRDKLDYKIFKFAHANKVDFDYYPQINTQSGLDTDFPELVTEKLKGLKPAPSKNQAAQIIRAKSKLYKTQKNADLDIKKILTTLCMEPEGKEISMVKGAQVIKDEEFARKVIISPVGKGKVRYVSVVPDSPNETIKRYAFDFNGNIISTYQTPDGIKYFNKAFKEALITKA